MLETTRKLRMPCPLEVINPHVPVVVPGAGALGSSLGWSQADLVTAEEGLGLGRTSAPSGKYRGIGSRSFPAGELPPSQRGAGDPPPPPPLVARPPADGGLHEEERAGEDRCLYSASNVYPFNACIQIQTQLCMFKTPAMHYAAGDACEPCPAPGGRARRRCTCTPCI